MTRFGRVPLWAAGLRDLGASDWRVLIVIAGHANGTGMAWPSIAAIGQAAGILRTNVPRSIERLVAAGLLCRITRSGPRGVNRYEVILEPPATVITDDVITGDVITDDVITGDTQLSSPVMTQLSSPVMKGTDQGTDQGTDLLRRRKSRPTIGLDDYRPDEAIACWAATNLPELPNPLDPQIVGAFVDHWKAHPARRPKDLDAGFRNWLRNEAKFAVRRSQTGGPSRPGVMAALRRVEAAENRARGMRILGEAVLNREALLKS